MSIDDLKIEDTNEIADFDRICQTLTDKLIQLGEIDYEGYRNRLRQLSSPMSDSLDPDILANDLKRIQAFKDSAVEIVRELTKVHLTYKRVVKLLTKGWPKYSVEKSAEKREGEALLKFSNYIMAENDAESAYLHAVGIMENLESQQENVSRQIQCAQISSKIGQNFSRVDNMTGWDNFDKPEITRSSTDEE